MVPIDDGSDWQLRSYVWYIEQMHRDETLYRSCTLCPRNCGIDRTAGQAGFCGQSHELNLAYAGLHFGEEPPISGQRGSGTVFFAGCTLKCWSCQNCQISHRGMGRLVAPETLSRIFLRLEEERAANINLVSASPFTPGILEALDASKTDGFSLPVVWNTSGYESRKTLNLLDAYVDIYLTDLKTLDSSLSRRLFAAADYPEIAQEGVLHMAQEKRNELRAGNMLRGVILRHLVLPGMLESTREVLIWFKENLYGRVLLSLMFQYTPVAAQEDKPDVSGIPVRRVSEKEYEVVTGWLEELEIEEGYVQEWETDSTWLPDFSKSNPFSTDLSRPVWHHAAGFI